MDIVYKMLADGLWAVSMGCFGSLGLMITCKVFDWHTVNVQIAVVPQTSPLTTKEVTDAD